MGLSLPIYKNSFVLLQILTSVGREIISHSWGFASVSTKYYLLSVLLFLYTNKELSTESFQDKILKDARLVISGIITVGIVFYIFDIGLTPQLELISELITLGYLGYLFWAY